MLNEIDLSRTDLNLLVLFEVVMRETHVGRAAERLSLSPSAVSHGLGRLRRLLHDPLFLRTPKGVAPTARALELAGPIAQVLAGARGVVAAAAPFEPRTATREFTVGAPDAVFTMFLFPLMARVQREAPGVDIRLRQVLPIDGRQGPAAWESVYADLDARAMDLAVGPFDAVPARFAVRELGGEDFVIVARAGHPYARAPGLESYCAASHVVVSMSGDATGFVDLALAERGLRRRVALTVPSFFMALAIVAATDLVAAVPRRFAQAHRAAAGLAVTEPPLPLPRFALRMVLPKAALADAGLAWLGPALEAAIVAPSPAQPARGRRQVKRK